jgi:hypothetical protein
MFAECSPVVKKWGRAVEPFAHAVDVEWRPRVAQAMRSPLSNAKEWRWPYSLELPSNISRSRK